MPRDALFVLSNNAERLRPVFSDPGLPLDVTFVDDLSTVEVLAAERNPSIALMFKDIGFDGPQLRQLAHRPSIKWVHASGSGYEFLEPVERTDLTITNGQGMRSRYLAETVIGAMISLNTGLLRYRDQQRSRQWQPMEFVPLEQQTLLIVGTGLIGRWVAQYAKTLGMYVVGVSRSGEPLECFDRIVPFGQLATLLPDADIISVHLRHTPETDRLFDKSLFDHMKTGVVFINTARGGIVDEDALRDALASGKIKNAYLDVFATEPLPCDSPLWGMDNLLITPHCADMITDWDVKAAEFFLANFKRRDLGDDLVNVVRLPSEPG